MQCHLLMEFINITKKSRNMTICLFALMPITTESIFDEKVTSSLERRENAMFYICYKEAFRANSHPSIKKEKIKTAINELL